MTLKPSAMLGLLGVLAAQPLSAAPDEVLEEVIVVAKRRMPIRFAPATVTLIDQQHIERTLSTDIRDLVRYEPGVSVRNDPVRFGLDSFAIRGIGGDRIAAEIDGVGVAESFSVGALADSGRVFSDLAFVRQVEILRGPASALYGSDAIGGVVYFQTYDPHDLFDAERSLAARVSVGFRSDANAWSATTLNAWSNGTAQLMLGYAHRDSEALDIAGPLKPNPRDSRSDRAIAKLVLPNVESGAIEIAFEAGRIRDETEVLALLGTPPRFVNTTAMHGDDTAEHMRLSIEQTLTPGYRWADEIAWRVHAQRSTIEQVTDETRRAAPPRSPPTQLERSFELEDDIVGAEITAATQFDIGSWSHRLIYGVEADVGRVTEVRDGYERNLSTGVVSNAILGEVFPVRDFPITQRFEGGLYVQDEMQIGETRWRVTPGLRFDVYRLRPREDAMYREDNPSARPVELDEQALTPKLAVAYALTPELSAFAQYARGFRSPPFEDVNIGLEIPLFNYRALPNPDLKPETSDAFELGLRAHGERWRATFNAHYTTFDDLIESRVNLGRDPATGATLFQSRNVESARMYGVEIASQLELEAFGTALRGWSAAFSAAWARGDNTASDEPLNSIEPLKSTLSLDYDALAGWWGTRLALTGVAAKERIAHGAEPLFRSDSFFVVDAFAYLTIAERGQLNIGLGNLTNERYIEWIDVRGRAASDPLVPYATHPGRNVSVNASWRF